MSSRQKPDFICIGAARSGTTALYGWLSQHPQIHVSAIKETNHFCADLMQVNGPGDIESLPLIDHPPLPGEKIYTARVFDWAVYQQLFKNTSGAVTGEISPAYMFYADTCAARIAAAVPDVKIIAVLREPATRALSNYLACRKWGRESRPVDQAFQEEERRLAAGWEHAWGYFKLGLYHQQLAHYLANFSRNQILVLLHEQIAQDPATATARIHRFLGLPSKHILTNIPVNTSASGDSLFLRTTRRLGVRSLAKLLPDRFVDQLAHIVHRNARNGKGPESDEFAMMRKHLRERYRPEVVALARDFPALDIAKHWGYTKAEP